MDILCGGILQAGFQYLVNIFYVQMMIFYGVISQTLLSIYIYQYR